ncbi:MAG: hypothetical protein V4543_07760 [Bacteroidota bacterium]
MEDLELEQILAGLGVSENKAFGFDILLLPEFYKLKDKFVDAQDSLLLNKLLKKEGLSSANAFDLGADINSVERKSSDIWLGTIFILSDVVLPIFIDVVSGLISKAVSEKRDRKHENAPYPSVHLKLRIKENGTETEINYKGDAETLDKILKSIKPK